jgi:hypothetical protein
LGTFSPSDKPCREWFEQSYSNSAKVERGGVLPIIWKAQKATLLCAIAEVLNDRGVPTPRGEA